MHPYDPAASPSPTTVSHPNHAIAMVAAVALARSPVLPGAHPTLPPQHDAGHVHREGASPVINEEHDERDKHRGRGDNDDNNDVDDGEYGFHNDVENGAGELDTSAAGYT